MERDIDTFEMPGSFKSARGLGNNLEQDITDVRNSTSSTIQDFPSATAMRSTNANNPRGDIFNVNGAEEGGGGKSGSFTENIVSGANTAGPSIIENAKKLMHLGHEETFNQYDGNEDSFSTSNNFENLSTKSYDNSGLEFSRRSMQTNKRVPKPATDKISSVNFSPQRLSGEEPDILMGLPKEIQTSSSFRAEQLNVEPTDVNSVQVAPATTVAGVATSLSEMMNQLDESHPSDVNIHANQDFNANHATPVVSSVVHSDLPLDTTQSAAPKQHSAYLAPSSSFTSTTPHMGDHSVASGVSLVGASAIAAVGALTHSNIARGKSTLQFTDPKTLTPLTGVRTVTLPETSTSHPSSWSNKEDLHHPSEYGPADPQRLNLTNPQSFGIVKEVVHNESPLQFTDPKTLTPLTGVRTVSIPETSTNHPSSWRNKVDPHHPSEYGPADPQRLNLTNPQSIGLVKEVVNNESPLQFTDPKTLTPLTGIRTVSIPGTSTNHPSSWRNKVDPHHPSEYGPADPQRLNLTNPQSIGLVKEVVHNESPLQFTDPKTLTPLTEIRTIPMTGTSEIHSSSWADGTPVHHPTEYGPAAPYDLKLTDPRSLGFASEVLPTTSAVISTDEDIPNDNNLDFEFDITNEELADPNLCPITFSEPQALKSESDVLTTRTITESGPLHSVTEVQEVRTVTEVHKLPLDNIYEDNSVATKTIDAPAGSEELLLTTFATSGIIAGQPHPSTVAKERHTVPADGHTHEHRSLKTKISNKIHPEVYGPVESNELLLETFATTGMIAGKPHPSKMTKNNEVQHHHHPSHSEKKVLRFTDPKALTPLTEVRPITIIEEPVRFSSLDNTTNAFPSTSYGPANIKDLQLTDPRILGQKAVNAPVPSPRKLTPVVPLNATAVPIPASKPVVPKVVAESVPAPIEFSDPQFIEPLTDFRDNGVAPGNPKNLRLADTSPLRPLSEKPPASAPVRTSETNTINPIPLLAPLPVIDPINLPLNRSSMETEDKIGLPIAPIPELSSTTLVDNSVDAAPTRNRRSTNPFDGMTSSQAYGKEAVSSTSTNPISHPTTTTTTTATTTTTTLISAAPAPIVNEPVVKPAAVAPTIPVAEKHQIPQKQEIELVEPTSAIVNPHHHTVTNDSIVSESHSGGSSAAMANKFAVVPENYTGPIPNVQPDEEIVWIKTTTTTTYPAGAAPPDSAPNASNTRDVKGLSQVQAQQEANVHSQYAPVEYVHPKKKGFFSRLFGRHKKDKGKARS